MMLAILGGVAGVMPGDFKAGSRSMGMPRVHKCPACGKSTYRDGNGITRCNVCPWNQNATEKVQP